MDGELLKQISIPVFTGVIGYVINWTGVQPDVAEALEQAGRFSHIVRRSIRLTPLGKDFCEAALPPGQA